MVTEHNFYCPPREVREFFPKWVTEIWQWQEDLFYKQIWRKGVASVKFLSIMMKRTKYAYILEGMMLRAFQIYRLYEHLGYKNFKTFCKEEHEKSPWQCNQIIKAALISWGLICKGFKKIPNCVAQATRLFDAYVQSEDEGFTIEKAWQRCLNVASGLNKTITANFIQSVVSDEPAKECKQIKIPVDTWKKLKAKADEEGLSLEDYLEELVKEEESEPQEEESTPEDKAPTENQEQDQQNTDNDTRTILPVQTDNGKRRGPSCKEIPKPNQPAGLLDDPIPY
ncbi:MAG: hypothetical protein SWX82_18980 [Cyanobacteriota bacterium]|nr:hypothetical protein [Cyanobacteriota bacterium]